MTAHIKNHARRPIRVLRVCCHLAYAGVQVCMTKQLQHLIGTEIESDVLVLEHPDPSAEEKESVAARFKEVCGRLIVGPDAYGVASYGKQFQRILRESAYDIVHTDVDELCGYFLRYAQSAGVKHRIAHSHIDSRIRDNQTDFARRLYRRHKRKLIAKHATFGFACSSTAASSLYGESWRNDPRWHVLPNGIDLQPFATQVDSTTTRAELGIPTDAFVIGHVASHQELKNPLFLLDVIREVRKKRSNAFLLMVGDGPMRPCIEQRIRDLGLQDRVVLAGVRTDVPRLLLGAMDAFLFPSLFEGFGNALLEAQAAGLPSLASDAVPPEAIVVPSIAQTLSLSKSAGAWAEELLRLHDSCGAKTRADALEEVRLRGFDIRTMSARLAATYRQLVGLSKVA